MKTISYGRNFRDGDLASTWIQLKEADKDRAVAKLYTNHRPMAEEWTKQYPGVEIYLNGELFVAEKKKKDKKQVERGRG